MWLMTAVSSSSIQPPSNSWRSVFTPSADTLIFPVSRRSFSPLGHFGGIFFGDVEQEGSKLLDKRMSMDGLIAV